MQHEDGLSLIVFLRNNMELIFAVIGFAVWLIRLEGRVQQVSDRNIETQKDIDDLRIRHESLDSKIVDQLTKLREDLAEIKGYLSSKKEE